MPGKLWSRDEETVLRQLVLAGEAAESIADRLGRTQNAVYQKALRLKLPLDDGTRAHSTSSSIQLPTELPSSEEALKMLAGALEAATQPGLDKVEVSRLQVVATLARAYDHLLANYIRYREIETKLIGLEQKYGQLAQKIQNNATQPNNAEAAQPQAK